MTIDISVDWLKRTLNERMADKKSHATTTAHYCRYPYSTQTHIPLQHHRTLSSNDSAQKTWLALAACIVAASNSAIRRRHRHVTRSPTRRIHMTYKTSQKKRIKNPLRGYFCGQIIPLTYVYVNRILIMPAAPTNNLETIYYSYYDAYIH